MRAATRHDQLVTQHLPPMKAGPSPGWFGIHVCEGKPCGAG